MHGSEKALLNEFFPSFRAYNCADFVGFEGEKSEDFYADFQQVNNIA